MGLSAAGATALAAGAGLIGTGAQVATTGKMNNRQRAFAEKMMHRQRDWALADYAMQNEYNSPQAQMSRLREAGLNPNLVYGNGATAEGGQVRSTPSAEWNPETPNIQQGVQQSAALGLQAYQNTEQRQLQNNLLKTQNSIAERDIQLRELKAAAESLAILRGSFQFGQDMKMAPYNLNMKKYGVEKLQGDLIEQMSRVSNATWDRNMASQRLSSDMQTAGLQREIMKISANKGTAEIKQIEQNIENMKKSGEWQQMENDLFRKMEKLNLTPSDPAWYRLITAVAEKLGRK